jgi:hypothetical protein
MAKHYVRDRSMASLGWIGHVGLGQDDTSTYFGTDDDGQNIYYSGTGAFVNEDGDPITPVGAVTSDSGELIYSTNVSDIAPAPAGVVPTPLQAGASAGTGQTYYGTDSKGNDIWVNSQGKYVNQDGLPVTPNGAISVEGGGTFNPATGATSGARTGTSIAAGALPALLAPGASPRVTVPVAPASAASFLTASSIIPGVSNLMIIGGVGLLAVLLAGKK